MSLQDLLIYFMLIPFIKIVVVLSVVSLWIAMIILAASWVFIPLGVIGALFD